MGLNTLVTNQDGEVASGSDVEQYKTAMLGDFVPRNASGVVEANAGNLGSETYPWKRANIKVGGLFCGMVMAFHDFNGAITPGQGWMKCNGDQVTEAAYDAIHGAGSWDDFIVTSPLNNKHLPSMNNKYLVGATNTSQNGSSAITYEGISGHTLNLAHTHTGPSHNHQWFDYRADPNNSRTYNSGGTAFDLNQSGVQTSSFGMVTQVSGTGDSFFGSDGYTTSSGSGNTSSALSSPQSIQPHSCAVEYWMRIV